MGKDNRGNLMSDHTGGYNIQGTIGLDVNNRKIAAGIFDNISIQQNLANGHVQARPGFNIHVSFVL